MLQVINVEYLARVNSALLSALMEASVLEQPGPRTVVFLSGEVTLACLNLIALVSNGSSATGTPSKDRAFCDNVAKSLRKRMAEVRKLREEGHLDWCQTVNAAETH